MLVTARKLKFRVVTEVGQDHTARKWGSWNLKPGSTIPKALSQDYKKRVAVHTFDRSSPPTFLPKKIRTTLDSLTFYLAGPRARDFFPGVSMEEFTFSHMGALPEHVMWSQHVAIGP